MKKFVTLLMVVLLGFMSIIIDPISAQAADDECKPTPVTDAFKVIRIGDKDGFGFKTGEGLVGSDGNPINEDGQGILAVKDVLPDVNNSGKINNVDEGNPFDNRSNGELATTYVTGSGFTDDGSIGSDWTDLSLGKSFNYKTSPTRGHPFPDNDPKPPNEPHFKFRFFVPKDKIERGTKLFFNIVMADYDLNEVGQIKITERTGKTTLLDLAVSKKEKGDRDGLIQSASTSLNFGAVFKDGDKSGKKPGYWIGILDVDLVAPEEAYTSFDFAEISVDKIPTIPCPPKEYKGVIQGLTWNDIDGNGDQSTIIKGNPPDMVFVVDVSGSTGNAFQGSAMGDVNGDGKSNTILDGEIAGFLALNQQVIDLGYGDTGKVSIVSFELSAKNLDMDPTTSGVQLSTAPGADKNGNGILDIQEVFSTLRSNGGTNYEAPLQLAQSTLNSLNTPTGKGNVVFMSDGVPGGGFTGTKLRTYQTNYQDEANKLQAANVNLTAFGAGSGAKIEFLDDIDLRAAIFTSTDELIAVFSGLQGTTGTSTAPGIEPVVTGVTMYLDFNNNGQLDSNEPSQVTDQKGIYKFTDLAPGSYVVREIVESGFTQTAPAGGFAEVTLGEDEIVSNINFGNTK